LFAVHRSRQQYRGTTEMKLYMQRNVDRTNTQKGDSRRAQTTTIKIPDVASRIHGSVVQWCTCRSYHPNGSFGIAKTRQRFPHNRASDWFATWSSQRGDRRRASDGNAKAWDCRFRLKYCCCDCGRRFQIKQGIQEHQT
jgi:hypothetical protein